MNGVVEIPAGGGEVVGDSPDRRVEILSDHEMLAATWSRFGPHRDGAELHVHREHTDLFYVLDGELTLRLGLEDEPVGVPAGKLVCIPPLVVHGFRNGSDAEVRYLNFHAPGMQFAEYLRALRDGRQFSYDQYEPPPDPRPASLVSIGDGIELEQIAVAELSLGELEPATVLRSLYALDGELAGSWIQIPPETAHSVPAARYLEVTTPARGYAVAPAPPSRA